MPPPADNSQPPQIFLVLILLLTILAQPCLLLCTRKECKCNYFQTNQRVSASCHFETRQRLTLQEADFPEELSSVELVGGRELRFGVGVLARPRFLERLTVSNVSLVFVQKNSFANLTSPAVLFEFWDSKSLILEEGSFRNEKGPASVKIGRVDQLVVHRAAFTWLSDLLLSDVARLDLHDEAFLLDNPLDKLGETPVTTITLERVTIEGIGRSTFHSSCKEISIVNSRISEIRTDAFDAIAIRGISIVNSTVERIAGGAFNDRTLVATLRLTNVTVDQIASSALPIGTTQLLIEQSTIKTVERGGINVTVAEAEFSSNTFGLIRSHGIRLEKWNSIVISGNRFERLDEEAFSAPAQPDSNTAECTPRCNFTSNTILGPLPAAGRPVFDLLLTEDVVTTIDSNYFQTECHCHGMSSDVSNIVSGVYTGNFLFDTSFCEIGKRASRCYGLERGPWLMVNYTEEYCDPASRPVCPQEKEEDTVHRQAAAAALPPVVPAVISSTDSVMVQDEIERERLIMGSVVVLFAAGMLIVLLVSLVKWIKNYNYCGKARTILISAFGPVLPGGTSGSSGVMGVGGMTPTGSAHSISRLSLHEYAELRRKCDSRNDELLEDKATQTMPEEVTQELLIALREKLNDPVDYREARDMLEHLYDLIKVEETKSDTTMLNGHEQDGNGDHDLTRTTRGTSPPPAAVIAEYLEPRDRTQHLYSEPNRPHLCDYSEPSDTNHHHVYTELPNLLANRPLPSKPTY